MYDIDTLVKEYVSVSTRYFKRKREIDDIVEGLIAETPERTAETLRFIEQAVSKRKEATK